MQNQLTEEQWHSYQEKGFLRLGTTLGLGELSALQERIDAIMLGTATGIDLGRLLMQLDSTTGKYEDAGSQSPGHKGATLAYRKIQNLEHDPLFREYTEGPVFRDICDRVYGPETPVACFRAMFMNKPANQGTWLPWHQDRWSSLDRDPLVTLWTALDPATKANGCVQIIEGSHKLGLVNPNHPSGFVSEEQAADLLKTYPVEFLELEPGESILLHNWLLHASDVNGTDVSRRAYSVCYMDGNTVDAGGGHFTRLFENEQENQQ